MIYFLEELDTYSDTWKMTFYFVFAIAILLGLFWTLFKMYKMDNQKKNKLKENIIYNKPFDAIENNDIIPKSKKVEMKKIQNHYDVYQTENKRLNQMNKDNIN